MFATQDRRQRTVTSRIEGELLVTARSRGDAIVFLFDAARPPPPAGTGRPIAFDIVPAAVLFGASLSDVTASGPFTAPFTFSLVPPGNYLIRGFIDVDSCAANANPCHVSDFNPWTSVTGEPNKGDVGGAAVDIATLKPKIIPVSADAPTRGVMVTFQEGATTIVQFDRPAFRVSSSGAWDGTGTKLIELLPQAIQSGAVDQQSPVFLARYADDDGNGQRDDNDKDGQDDLYPKVIVRKLQSAAPYLLDENDLDRNGIVDAMGPTSVDYEHVNPSTGASIPADGNPDVVVLRAGVVRDELVAALSGGAPFAPVTRLLVGIQPVALDVSNPAAPAPLKKVPSGRYAVTVIQFTGQTWRLPNEQTPLVNGALGVAPHETQGFTIEVP